jgi:hypothetical protein
MSEVRILPAFPPGGDWKAVAQLVERMHKIPISATCSYQLLIDEPDGNRLPLPYTNGRGSTPL